MTQANNLGDLKQLAELAKEIEGTAIAQFLRDLSPILQANARLIELGLEAVEREANCRVKLLSPKEFAEDMGVSVRTLARWQSRWAWFRPAHGKGKGQRYPSSLKARISEELNRQDGGDHHV